MKVMKFGGTSVGTPQRIKDVSSLVTEREEKVFVVLSAMSGTTNSLVDISNYLYKKNPDGANEVINKLEEKYKGHVQELFSTEEYKSKTLAFLEEEFAYLRSFTKELFTSFEEKNIVAQGEIISTNMVTNYLMEQGKKVVLLNALDFIRTDKNAEPDPVYIKQKLQALMEKHEGYQVYITQGFICRNAYGEVDNLQRGGSDYTFFHSHPPEYPDCPVPLQVYDSAVPLFSVLSAVPALPSKTHTRSNPAGKVRIPWIIRYSLNIRPFS